MVFFRGLEMTDEQQVTIAKTLGNIVQSEGEDGIYKISLDKNVNQRAEYSEGLDVLAFRRFAAALPESCGSAAGHQTIGNRWADRVLQHLRGIRRLAAVRKGCHRRPSGGTQCGAFAVLRTPEMSYEEITFWQKSPTKTCPMVWTHQSGRKSLLARRHSGLRDRDARGGEPRAAWHGFATGPPSRSTSIDTTGRLAIC